MAAVVVAVMVMGGGGGSVGGEIMTVFLQVTSDGTAARPAGRRTTARATSISGSEFEVRWRPACCCPLLQRRARVCKVLERQPLRVRHKTSAS